MAHSSEDDFAESKRLRKVARNVSSSGLRRRMQSTADKLLLRGIKKIERRFKTRVPRGSPARKDGDSMTVAKYLSGR